MNCSVSFETRSLIVSRSFLKKASVPFSEEYKMLACLTKQHPDFTLMVKATAPHRPQYMPTYAEMLAFIHRQDDAEEMLEEFNKAKQISRNAYMYVRRWFLTQFPEMNAAA